MQHLSNNISTSMSINKDITMFPSWVPTGHAVPYFFDYKMEFFSFQNNPKDLDPSCKTDLDLWDCLGKVKIGIIATFHTTDLVI